MPTDLFGGRYFLPTSPGGDSRYAPVAIRQRVRWGPFATAARLYRCHISLLW